MTRMQKVLVIVAGLVLAHDRANAQLAEQPKILTPPAGTAITLGKAPVQVSATVPDSVLNSDCKVGDAPPKCSFRCLVVQDTSGPTNKWQGPIVSTPSCVFPAKDQSQFRIGPARIGISWNRASANLDYGWIEGTGNPIIFTDGKPLPVTPLEKFFARRSEIWGKLVSTASSQGATITYREAIDRNPTYGPWKWKPLSRALAQVKRGAATPASWDAQYGVPWAWPDSGGGVSCPSRDSVGGKPAAEIRGGVLSFQVTLDQNDDSVVNVRVPVGADGKIQGNVALTPVQSAAAHFAAVTVHGSVANEDALYDRDRVRFGRVLQVEVTPSTNPKVGCAFRSAALDHLEARECIRRGEAITLSAVHSDGFNSMERCCRGLRANPKLYVCQ